MRRLSDDRGTMAIIVAVLFTSLCGMAALAIDIGALLVEHRALQNGADASAIAIARDCMDSVMQPPGPTPCTQAAADATATTYFAPTGTLFDTTVTPAATVTLSAPAFGGRVGGVTVVGDIDQPPLFARFLGVTTPIDVSAVATARWGPVTTLDTVFPLVVCDGALPAPNVGPDTLIVPAPTSPPLECDGAPFQQPFGWMPVDDPAACTSEIDLLPATSIDVNSASTEPTNAGCVSAIDDLHDAIDFGTAEDRTRVLAVYDPDAGWWGGRPAWALIAFEFTGAHFGGRTSHVSAGSWSPACDVTDPTVRCIEGIVRTWVPPEDAPVVDPSEASFPGINDSTVLDVRLTE